MNAFALGAAALLLDALLVGFIALAVLRRRRRHRATILRRLGLIDA